MCIELHKPSAESVNAHLECAQDEKYVPSQFERETPADTLKKGIEIGYRGAVHDSAALINGVAKNHSNSEVRAILLALYCSILELKP